MPNHMSFVVAFTGLVGFALLVLSIIEFRKPSQIAKMTGLTWVFFAVAVGNLSVSQFFIGTTWHWPNAQKPWVLINTLGGIALFFMVMAFVMLMRVVAARGTEATELETETADKPHPTEGVWLPPPMRP